MVNPDPPQALRQGLPGWMRQRRSWRLLLLVLLGVVSWFAFAPLQFEATDLPVDKLRHLGAFAALSWVAVQAAGGSRHKVWRIALPLLAYGVAIELVQSQIPGRHGSVMDVGADAVGIALGLWCARWFSPVR